MKAFSLSCIAVFFLINASFAQYQKAVGKAIIKTPTIKCDKCKDKVEFFISHSEGVSSVKINIKQNTTTVSWLNDRTSLESIKVAIANLGYDADDIEAEAYAFKRLPKECKLHKEAVKPVIAPNNQ